MQSLIKGQIFVTTDPRWIEFAINNGWIVGMLVDHNTRLINPLQFSLSTLLPPPESVFATIDNNIDIGRGIYLNYLSSNRETEIGISTILSHITRTPGNVLLYTEDDANKQFNILQTLAEFFNNTFGITFGYFDNNNNIVNCIINSNDVYNTNIADLLFRNGFINKEEFSMILPDNSNPSILSCGLLLNSINYGFNSTEEYIQFCKHMLLGIKEQRITGKINPMIAVK